MKVLFRARARADIEAIIEYLESRSSLGARNVAQAIHAAIAALAYQPEGSQRTDDPAVRVKTVQGYPYRIFYTYSEGVIEILHIRHAARRPWTSVRDPR